MDKRLLQLFVVYSEKRKSFTAKVVKDNLRQVIVIGDAFSTVEDAILGLIKKTGAMDMSMREEEDGADGVEEKCERCEKGASKGSNTLRGY